MGLQTVRRDWSSEHSTEEKESSHFEIYLASPAILNKAFTQNKLPPPHNWLQLRSGRTAISNPSGSNLPHEVREISRPSPLWHSCLTWCKGEGFVKVLEPRYHFSQRLRLTHGTVVCFPSSHKLSPHQKWSCKIARACYQKNSRPQTLFQKTSLGKPKENRGTKTETSDAIFISDIKSYCHQ